MTTKLEGGGGVKALVSVPLKEEELFYCGISKFHLFYLGSTRDQDPWKRKGRRLCAQSESKVSCVYTDRQSE